MKEKKQTKETIAPKVCFWLNGMLFTSREEFKKYIEQTKQ